MAKAKEEVVAKEKEATVVKFSLPNEKVYVKPNINNAGWIKNPKHKAFFMMDGAVKEFFAPLQRNGKIKNVLTDEEKDFLEDMLQMNTNDLSVYKKPEDNFWATFSARVSKDVTELNLADPFDYIKYKLLLANTDLIAPNLKSVKNKATYKFYIEKPTETAMFKSQELDKESLAWEAYGMIANDKGKMLDFLRVYGEINKTARAKAHSVNKSSAIELVKSTVKPILAENKEVFYNILKDKNYETKLLLSKAVEKGFVERKGTTYTDKGSSKAFAESFQKGVDFLNNPENSDFRSLLETQIN